VKVCAALRSRKTQNEVGGEHLWNVGTEGGRDKIRRGGSSGDVIRSWPLCEGERQGERKYMADLEQFPGEGFW